MIRLIFILVIALFSCDIALAVNSNFSGQYNLTISYAVEGDNCTAPEPYTATMTFGNDSNSPSDSYIYIPDTGSTTTFSYTTVSDGSVEVTFDVTISIVGDTIRMDYVRRDTGENIITWIYSFSNDYNTITVTGTFIDDYCNLRASGTAARIGSSDNSTPNRPVSLSPADGSANVSLTPILTTNAFSDPDTGDIHSKTAWQIATAIDFTSVILSNQSTTNLTSLVVPAPALQEGTTYYWRVKYYDNNNNESEWSNVVSFTTLQTQNDTNKNGIPDSLENNTVDLNGDGIPDINQTNEIKSFNTVVGSGQMGISIKDSITVTQTVEVNSIDPEEISQFVRPYDMPLGLVSFRLNVTNPGDTATIKVYFSEAAQENAAWFFYDSINGWIDYSQYVTFSADRKSASIQLKDGDYGDADGVENGIIVDPSGFGIASWLKGKITASDTSQGISKGTVTISDINLTLNTLSDGSYLSMILPGTYNVEITAAGYSDKTIKDIKISEAAIVTKDIALAGRCKISGLEVFGTPSTTTPTVYKTNAISTGTTINYRYSIHGGYGTSNYSVGPWSSMTLTEYITDGWSSYTFGSSDKYIVVVWATSSPTDTIDTTGIPTIGWSVDTSNAECRINFTGLTITGSQKANEKITFTLSAENSCNKNLFYRYTMHPYYGTDEYNGTHWQSMTSTTWVSNNSVDYTFTDTGKYVVVVWVTDNTTNVNPNGIPIIGWSVDIE